MTTQRPVTAVADGDMAQVGKTSVGYYVSVHAGQLTVWDEVVIRIIIVDWMTVYSAERCKHAEVDTLEKFKWMDQHKEIILHRIQEV